MATKLKIIDRQNSLRVEIDGTSVPWARGYTINRSPSGTVTLKVVVVMNDADIEIDSESKINVNESRRTQ